MTQSPCPADKVAAGPGCGEAPHLHRRRDRDAVRRGVRSAAWREGLIAIAPTLPGTFSWGIVTGIGMVKSGLTVGQAVAMSLVMYAGTAQLAVLPLFAAGAGLPLIWLTGLLANLRFVIYSATAAPLFRRLPRPLRVLVGYWIIDSGLAIYLNQLQRRGRPVHRMRLFFGIHLPAFLVWHVGSLLGILGAGWIGSDQRFAFIGTLAIAALCGPMLRGRAALTNATVAALVAIALAALPLRLGLFVAVLAAVLVSLMVARLSVPDRADPSP